MTGLRPGATEQDLLHIDPDQFEICSAWTTDGETGWNQGTCSWVSDGWLNDWLCCCDRAEWPCAAARRDDRVRPSSTSTSLVFEDVFRWLRQWRWVRRSLGSESVIGPCLYHVAHRLYCNLVLAPKSHWWVAMGVECYCMSHLRHRQVIVDCHSYFARICTDIPQRVRSTSSLSHYDRSSLSPESSTNVPRWLLRPSLRRCRSPSSAICRCPSMTVPRVRHSTFGCHTFASVSSTVWNPLPEYLCNTAVGHDQFRRDLAQP